MCSRSVLGKLLAAWVGPVFFGLVCLLTAGPVAAKTDFPPVDFPPIEPPSACLTADDPETDWGGACLSDSQGAVPPWVEYGRQVEESSRLAALEFGFAGEQTNRYDGSTYFSVVDIDLPGNFDLPVRLVRYLDVSLQPQDRIQPYDTRLGGAGNWDVDVPWMAATYPQSTGWNDQRCSQGSVPPLTMGPHGRFRRAQVWQGIDIHMPGEEARRAMGLESGVPLPSSGGPYRLTSRQRDVFSCIPMQSGLAGEGFRMTTREGVHYDFDVAVDRTASKLVRPLKSNGQWLPHYLERDHFYLLASRIEDRHGNTVEIDYNSFGQPTRISASDGREITLDYTNGRLTSATANHRTWQYQYQDGELTRVELPDGSHWTYSYSGSLKPSAPEAWEDLVLPWCMGLPAKVDAQYTLTATHPAGAQAKFEFSNRRHYRTGVHATECLAYGQGEDAVYELLVPHYFDVMSLVVKTVSGPGLEPASWSYDYGLTYATLWGSHTEPAQYPCSNSQECQQDKSVTITRPDGSHTVERYGVVYRHNAGRLLERQRLPAGSSTAVRSEQITYLDEQDVAGQPFYENYGTVLGSVGDPITAQVRPMVQSSLTQEGTTYTRIIDAFDSLAREKQATESNTMGASRQVETIHHDNLDLWVLGQVDKISMDGVVAEQTSYTTATAQPWKHWRFGRLDWTREYNSDGILKKQTDGNNHSTRPSQWHRGVPGHIKYADDHVITAVIDDNGWITSTTDELGATTRHQYDGMGRLVRTIHPPDVGVTWEDTVHTFEYIDQPEYGLPAGHWRLTRSVGRERTVTHYDGLWRPVVEEHFDSTDRAGTLSQTVNRYDVLGREAFRSWPLDSVVDYTTTSQGQHSSYDALDRVTARSVDTELGTLTTLTGYLSGSRVRVTDPKGHITQTTYQTYAEPVLEHPLEITFAKGSPTEVTTNIVRDVFGHPLSMIQYGSDQGQNLSVTHTFGYDAHHQLCRHTGPETATTAYGHDGAGNLAWKAEGLTQSSGCPPESGLPGSSKIRYQYDARDRLTAELYPTGTGDKHFDYLPNGLLETATRSAAGGQPGSAWTYQWFNRGLLKSETLAIDGHQFTLNHGYNSEGHPDSMSYPSGRTISFSPNGLGQPTRLGSHATNIRHAPNGQPQSLAYGNGIEAHFSYNTRQLRSQTVYSLAGSPLVHRSLEYDPNGNLGAITDMASSSGCAVVDTIFCSRFEAAGDDGSDSRSFVYDELDRLLEVINPIRQDQFSYDPLGNLRSASDLGSWTYDSHNRIQKRTQGSNTFNYSWDTRGNLLHDGQRSYSWNRANELTADGDGGQYAHDANGWRVWQKRGSGAAIYSIYDQQQRLVVRYDAQTGTQTDFVHLGSRPIARIEGNQTTYIHPDYQNSPLIETSPSATITRQPVYLGYGQTDAEGTSEIPGYTGATMDAETGQTYLGARYLYQNRFTSPDPAALDPARPSGLNRYAYADNNPMRYVDPDGRFPVDTFVDVGFVIWDVGSFLGASAAAGVGWATGNEALMSAGLEGMGETGTNLGIDAAAAVTPYLAAPVARLGVKGVKTVSKSVDDLSRAASASDRGGLTAAGRALQKHGSRKGSAFPSVRGTPRTINRQGQDIVDDILTSPGATTTQRHHARFGDVIEVRAPDGRGVRYSPDRKFLGFLEPKR